MNDATHPHHQHGARGGRTQDIHLPDAPGNPDASPAKAGMNRPLVLGTLTSALMLAVYFGALSLVSGWAFTVSQFAQFWYFVVPLAIGFGVQVGLFVHLRERVGRSKPSGRLVAASGTTSTAAMVSCCAHYLVNVAPVLGATGLVAFAAQFQIEFFWIGLLFNAAGIAYVATQVVKASRQHEQCLT
jgi:P-type Cu+ transporter